MKIKRLIPILLGALLVFSFSITVFATPTKPYGSYGVSRPVVTQGKAAIYKCSCNPVDNYLKASCKVQYYNPDTLKYTTTAWHSGSSSNTPGHSASWTVAAPSKVNYVWGEFQARCGTGTTKSYSAEKGYSV